MKRSGPLRRKYDAEKIARHADWRAGVMHRANWKCEAVDLPHLCASRAEEPHHVLPRSRGGKDVLDNGLAVCAEAHRTIHSYPVHARELGYLR